MGLKSSADTDKKSSPADLASLSNENQFVKHQIHVHLQETGQEGFRTIKDYFLPFA